jgi:hypothetical protein
MASVAWGHPVGAPLWLMGRASASELGRKGKSEAQPGFLSFSILFSIFFSPFFNSNSNLNSNLIQISIVNLHFSFNIQTKDSNMKCHFYLHIFFILYIVFPLLFISFSISKGKFGS